MVIVVVVVFLLIVLRFKNKQLVQYYNNNPLELQNFKIIKIIIVIIHENCKRRQKLF